MPGISKLLGSACNLSVELMITSRLKDVIKPTVTRYRFQLKPYIISRRSWYFLPWTCHAHLCWQTYPYSCTSRKHFRYVLGWAWGACKRGIWPCARWIAPSRGRNRVRCERFREICSPSQGPQLGKESGPCPGDHPQVQRPRLRSCKI